MQMFVQKDAEKMKKSTNYLHKKRELFAYMQNFLYLCSA